MPKITLITPIYNRAEIFERTFESVKQFLNEDIEYLIISDGSQDIDKLQKFLITQNSPNNVKLIHYSENGGVGKALNLGIKESTGEWVSFLGSDDELLPNWYSSIVAADAEKDDSFNFFYFKLLYIDGRTTPTPLASLKNLNYSNYLKYINQIIMRRKTDPSATLDMGVVVRSQVAKKIKFSEGWTYENRWHLELNRVGRGFFLEVPLKLVHIDSTDRLSTSNFRINSEFDVVKNINQRSEFRKTIKLHGVMLKKYSPSYLLDFEKKILRRSINLVISPRFSVKSTGFRCFLKDLFTLVGDLARWLLANCRVAIFEKRKLKNEIDWK